MKPLVNDNRALTREIRMQCRWLIERVQAIIEYEMQSFDFEEGEVEIVELTVGANAAVVGQHLHELKSKLPERALVATILRGDDVIVPSGEDTLEGGDSVVLFST